MTHQLIEPTQLLRMANDRGDWRLISIPTTILAHYVGDALAWSGAIIAGRWQYMRWPHQAERLASQTSPIYFLALGIGALVGAWLFGSINTLHSALVTPSHSIAGALAGGIVGVELWKWLHGMKQTTGGAFVLPICTGIVIGRIGCLFSGLPDFTYGVPTAFPWGVNLGDGVSRHPVQLYEAASMAVFLVIFLRARITGRRWATAHAFHAMIIVYAAQRFMWEFLKPYPKLMGQWNIFHFLMVGLILYGLVWWRRSDRASQAPL